MRNTLIYIVLLALSFSLYAQLPPPTKGDAHAFKKVEKFSPYAGRNFPTSVYWGDTHLWV